MFGPQARAAELQAMRSAAKRQRAIPLPAAASLTEFVRPLSSKNKGIKTFKPLVPGDLEEDQTNDDVLSASPASTSTLPPTESAAQESAINPPRHQVSAPKAPRAMLNCTPKQIPAHKQTALSHARHLRNMYYNVPDVFGWMSPSPMALNTHMQWQTTTPDVEVSPQRPLWSTASGFLFGNEGYSPTKVEMKLQAQRQLGTRSQAEHISPSKGTTIVEPLRMKYEPAYPHPDFHRLVYGTTLLDIERSARRPTFDRVHNRCTEVEKMNHPGLSHLDLVNTSTRDMHRVYDANYDFSNNPFPSHAADYPYNRDIKMQTFVAAQQAMRKTSKTVLNNPEIRKPLVQKNSIMDKSTKAPQARQKPDSYMRTFSSWQGDTFASTARQGSGSQSTYGHGGMLQDITADPPTLCDMTRRKAKECPAIRLAMCVRDDSGVLREYEEPRSEVPDEGYYTTLYSQACVDVAKNLEFDSWCMLKPIDGQDREKLQRMRLEIAADTTISGSMSQIGDHVAITGVRAKQWLHGATIGQNALQKRFDRIIDDHVLNLEECGKQIGVIGQPASTKAAGVDIEILKAVANLVAMMAQYENEQSMAYRRDSRSEHWSSNIEQTDSAHSSTERGFVEVCSGAASPVRGLPVDLHDQGVVIITDIKSAVHGLCD